MENDIDLIKKQLKDNIQQLVDAGDLKEAKKLIEQYKNMAQDDVEAYSMDAVILIMEGKLEQAEQVLREGLIIDEDNFDLNYNLGYVYEKTEKFNLELDCYKKARSSCNDEKLKEQINSTINAVRNKHPEAINNKLKLVFFVKQGMDSFLGDIIDGLSDEYTTKKVIVTDFKQIDKGMQWADICWFEWCDELVIYGSKLPMAKEKKIICRLHRYEAFSNYLKQVDWDNIDKVIFVAEHIRDTVINKVKLSLRKCEVIYNGINLNKFKYYRRSKGFNLAWIGYLNLRKNPMFIIQSFYELFKIDRRYKLHFAGSFQDESLYCYMKRIIEKLGIQNNVYFDGFIENDKMSKWVRNKNYIVSGSIAEGHPVGIMEAMASGLKPVIHYFPGCENFYPKEYIFYNINDFEKIIEDKNYDSSKYRKFIEDNYSLERQINSIKSILSELKKNISANILLKTKLPLVSVCIPVYNGEKYIKYTIDSVLNQTYKNLEIIICDNCSTDNTVSIVESYNDKRIKLYKNRSNIGALNNSNKCIELSSGYYIKFVYADDIINRNTLEEMVSIMEKNSKIALSAVNFCHIDEKNSIITKPILNMSSGKYSSKPIFRRLVIEGNIIGCPSGVMIRKSFLNIVGLFKDELKYMSDYDMWIKLCKVGDFYFINKSYMYFRVHLNSISNNNISTIKRVKDFYYLLNKYIDDINFSKIEIETAYKNANNRSYYSLKVNNNLNEKLKIINYILDNSKYIPKSEKMSLINLKKGIKEGNINI